MPIDAIDEQIRACLNRNLYESAFDLIVTHFSDKIMHLTYSIVSNDAFAEDVVQDVLLRAWRGLPAYRGEASVSTWIYSITRNTCLTALRRVGHKNSLSIEEPAVRMEMESLPSLQQSALLWDLPTLLTSLPDKQRQVFVLFYMEDKSYAEVALLWTFRLAQSKPIFTVAGRPLRHFCRRRTEQIFRDLRIVVNSPLR